MCRISLSTVSLLLSFLVGCDCISRRALLYIVNSPEDDTTSAGGVSRRIWH